MEGKMKPNPLMKAGFLSKLLFWWMNDTFNYGYKHTLQESDMFKLLKDDTSDEVCKTLERNWEKQLENAKNGKKPSLLRALFKTHHLCLIHMGIILFLLESSRISIPFFMGGLIHFIENKETTPIWMAYAYASGISFSSLFFAFTWQFYFYRILRIGWHMRTSVCALMYKKTLRLSQRSISESTTGKIVNLSSTDVLRFDEFAYNIQFLWLGPLVCLAVGIILWQFVGIAILAGMGCLALLMIAQSFFGVNYGKVRNQTAVITDRRIRVMNEIIAGMKIIKMYMWEKPFAKVVSNIRRKEIAKFFMGGLLQSAIMSIYLSFDKVLTLVTIGVYIARGGEISASMIFPILTVFQLVRITVGRGFSIALGEYFSCMVSINRAQTYLMLEEAVDTQDSHAVVYQDESFVEFENYSARWEKISDKECIGEENLTLKDISIRVDTGQLLAVIGPVGSGKSSILSAILGQLPTCGGSINVNGEITFANQVPWVFSGTVKENILFGESYDMIWYQKVIDACALVNDINLLPHGDETLVGERGVTLSGGQKARVNLARAVYRKDASICLLDDPLSAVDAAVGNHIFEHCICGLLKDKVCILVTHQLYYLKKADKIIILKEGKIAAVGTYDELQADGTDFAALLQKQETENEENVSENISDYFSNEESDDDEYYPSSQLSISPSINGIQPFTSMKLPVGSQEDLSENYPLVQQNKIKHDVPEELRKEGKLSRNVYFEYFTVGVNCCVFLLFLFLVAVSQSVFLFSDWWISFWTNNKAEYTRTLMQSSFNSSSGNVTAVPTYEPVPKFDNSYFLMMYGVIAFFGLFFSFFRCLAHFYVLLKSSETMHNKMFRSILRSPMRFFDTNPVGRILNRFSKDLGQIDERLPFSLLELSMSSIFIVTSIILLIVINYYVLIIGIPVVLYFLWIRGYYLRTGNDIKRLEGTTRSPVFSLLSSSLDGMATIRAFKVEKEFEQKFHRAQDLHSSSWFLHLAGIQWLSIRLYMLTAILISVVSYLCVLTVRLIPINPGLIGLTLTYSVALVSLSEHAVRTSAHVESLMTSVERVQQYYSLPSEAEEEMPNRKPDPDWPLCGDITFHNVSFAYYKGGPTILRNVSFEIRAMEKIGIVGRTGAGKSSLISALFRLSELTGGEIFIDGIPITPLGLHDLRKVISIIPQDPVLFSGTMRYNLDPISHYKDEELWNALEQVQLKEVVESLPLKLSSEFAESGSNFSVGQRQLVCLARAVLWKSKILVIDEATANVDLRTDRLIQLTIREKFKHCTVLTIAHRLNTIIDSDRVMIMENGQLKEFDEPYVLLQDPNSLMTNLAQKTRRGQMELLLRMAEEAHKRKVLRDRNYITLV